jgi:ATP-dependent DNA ligase
MKKSNQLPPLYHRAKGGEVRVWKCWTVGATVHSESGVLDGKMVPASYVCTPKNVGRANATTAEEQAVLEAKAEWDKKLARKYREEIPPEDNTLENLPMLAKSFFEKGQPGVLTSHAKKAAWPVDVQIKFDGLRAKARRIGGKVVLLPRSGQVSEAYEVRHVVEQLAWLPEGMELDGELYVHGRKLQEIASLAKRWRAESEVLVYHVYDMPMCNGSRDGQWSVRRGLLAGRVLESANVRVVETFLARNVETVERYAQQFREDGFEGAIVRLTDGVYECGFRSSALLKVKEHLDEEFEVTGCEQGVGKDVGTATFLCKTKKGVGFSARMRGTLAERQAFWKSRASYVGKMLTVSFVRWTLDGVPQEPVGECFREDRDRGRG